MIKKKHAYLIMPHDNINILIKQLKLLDDERNDIYIHIDKKSDICKSNLENIIRKSNVNIYKEIEVNWAALSQVKTEIFLLKKAVKNNYMYYHLLSGVDMPIKTQDYIHNFFEKNCNKEFVHFQSDNPSKEVLDRIKYYYIFLDNKWYRKSNLLKILNKCFIFIQKILHVSRKSNILIRNGANWFSITNELARYIVKNEENILKEFKYTSNADEIFLQTYVENSKFKENLYEGKYDNDYHACMRMIDWNRGNPYTFKKSDFDDIIKSDFLFARKFNESVDNEIVNLIFEYIERERSNE